VVAGIFSFVKEQKNLHHLDAYRNKQGEINIIGLC
jgi:tRNA A37 threonylcarbamoyladenosine biosynthesis protein TsaE